MDAVTISMIISVISVIVVVSTLFHNLTKDAKAEVEKDNDKLEVVNSKYEQINASVIKANIKLDQVLTTTNETRTDIKSLDARMQDMDKRVTIVERDLKTAFTRIDEVREEKGND